MIILQHVIAKSDGLVFAVAQGFGGMAQAK